MPFSGDDRGQSVVVGAVILFGFLVVAMSTYQATVVPQQNSQAEFGHEQTVRDDFVGVRDAVVTTGTTGETIPASVKLGTRFPDRTLFVNPPPAVGRIETGEPRNVTLNVSRADFSANVPESDETRDGWPTTAATNGNYTTKTLVYTPQYRAYDGGPANVTLESAHVLARYDDGTTVNLTQSPLLVSGSRVTLFLLRGNLTESGVDDVTVEPSAVSPVSDRVQVSNFNVTVPTTLSAGQFESVLSRDTQIDVENVTVTENTTRRAVDVRFRDNRSLAVAAVSVGRHEEPRQPAAVEFVSVERSVTQGESARVAVRVRDQYGNTLPGAAVSANSSDLHDAGERRLTDDRGRAAFEFNTSRTTGNPDPRFGVAVNVTVNGSVADELNGTASRFNQSTAENATTNVTVASGSSPPDGGQEVVTVSWNFSSMESSPGIRYSSGNDTLLVDRATVGDRFPMLANATDTNDGSDVSGVQLDFTSGNPSVVDFDVSGSNEPGPTNADGELSSPAVISTEGVSEANLFGASTSDTITVKTVGQNTPSPPPNGRAFADDNQNGQYDPGEEDYEKSKLLDFNETVHLVIPSTVGTVNSGGSRLSIEAKSITSEVSLDSGGGRVDISTTQGDAEFATGTTIASGGETLALRATGSVRADDVTLESGGGQIDLGGAAVFASDATLDSGGSRLSVDVDGSTLQLGNADVRSNGGVVDLDTTGDLRVADASIDSNGKETTLTADRLFAEGARFTGGGAFTADVDETVDATDAVVRTNGARFSLTAGGSVLADDVRVETNGSPLVIEASNGDDVRLRGGQFGTNGAVFDVATDGGTVCLNRSPDTDSRTEIRTNGEKARVTDAATTYLDGIFVSSSGGGLRYNGPGGVKGDYYGPPASRGDGINRGGWERQVGGNDPCGS